MVVLCDRRMTLTVRDWKTCLSAILSATGIFMLLKAENFYSPTTIATPRAALALLPMALM